MIQLTEAAAGALQSAIATVPRSIAGLRLTCGQAVVLGSNTRWAWWKIQGRRISPARAIE
jgi:hypothetical protein